MSISSTPTTPSSAGSFPRTRRGKRGSRKELKQWEGSGALRVDSYPAQGNHRVSVTEQIDGGKVKVEAGVALGSFTAVDGFRRTTLWARVACKVSAQDLKRWSIVKMARSASQNASPIAWSKREVGGFRLHLLGTLLEPLELREILLVQP